MSVPPHGVPQAQDPGPDGEQPAAVTLADASVAGMRAVAPGTIMATAAVGGLLLGGFPTAAIGRSMASATSRRPSAGRPWRWSVRRHPPPGPASSAAGPEHDRTRPVTPPYGTAANGPGAVETGRFRPSWSPSNRPGLRPAVIFAVGLWPGLFLIVGDGVRWTLLGVLRTVCGLVCEVKLLLDHGHHLEESSPARAELRTSTPEG